MKKISIIISALSIILFTPGAFAQEQENSDSREDLQFGIKAGLNSSNVYDEEAGDFTADPKIGFVTGAFLSIPIGKFLGIQPEVLFSQKGYKASGTILFNTYNYTRTLDYIDIPLQLQLKPAEFLTVVAGPAYSFLISSKEEFTYGTISSEQEEEIENDNIRKNILSAVGGVDVNILPVVISGRVGWDLQNNNGDGTSTSPRYKNVWVQATIGFKF